MFLAVGFSQRGGRKRKDEKQDKTTFTGKTEILKDVEKTFFMPCPKVH